MDLYLLDHELQHPVMLLETGTSQTQQFQMGSSTNHDVLSHAEILFIARVQHFRFSCPIL